MRANSPSGSTTEEAEAFLKAHPDVEAFDIVLTDVNGVGRGKIIRRHELLPLYESGRHLPISILGLDITGADGAKMSGDPEAGKAKFNVCAACHAVEEGKNKVGPTLYGVVGRVAGTVEGFNYSKANKESGITWSEQELFVYLENPREKVPGTKMAYAGMKDAQDRANLIAYLKGVGAAATP